MSRNIARQQTPEERELSKKLEDLSSLQILLVQRELDLATLQAELNAFERRYLRFVGTRYAELDEVEAQIAETLSRSSHKNHQAQERADQTRARANESAHASKIVQEPTIHGDRFIPSDALKKLYREVAKCIHPDLATDENDRMRRQRFMVEANQAYEAGDEVRLREILREWESSPEAIKGDGVGAELIRVIRKISQVEGRLLTIETAITQPQSSDLYRLLNPGEVAKCIHPDLATDENDRMRRQRFMVEANQAYEAGDEVRLREILREWESSPEAIKGDGVGAELIRVIRKISQVEGRLLTIETAITQPQSSDLYRLNGEVEKAETQGRDLLAEMGSRLDQQIADAKAHLASLIQEKSNHVR